MNAPIDQPLSDPLLDALGIEHGFGQRGTGAPEGCTFPKQVHGIEVVEVGSGETGAAAAVVSADAVVTCVSGAAVGIVTADCVPLLVGRSDGSAVGAIHAGWRGLAAGVIEQGIAALGGAAPHALGEAKSLHDQLVGIVPVNIMTALVEGDMLATIFFATLFGFGVWVSGAWLSMKTWASSSQSESYRQPIQLKFDGCICVERL